MQTTVVLPKRPVAVAGSKLMVITILTVRYLFNSVRCLKDEHINIWNESSILASAALYREGVEFPSEV